MAGAILSALAGGWGTFQKRSRTTRRALREPRERAPFDGRLFPVTLVQSLGLVKTGPFQRSRGWGCVRGAQLWWELLVTDHLTILREMSFWGLSTIYDCALILRYITGHTKELKVQGITSMRTPRALARRKTNKASSWSCNCQSSAPFPSTMRPTAQGYFY